MCLSQVVTLKVEKLKLGQNTKLNDDKAQP